MLVISAAKWDEETLRLIQQQQLFCCIFLTVKTVFKQKHISRSSLFLVNALRMIFFTFCCAWKLAGDLFQRLLMQAAFSFSEELASMLLVSLISCEARKLLLCPSISAPTFFTLPKSSSSSNINTPQYFDRTAFGYEIYGLCFLNKKKKSCCCPSATSRHGARFNIMENHSLTKCSYQ